MKPQDNPGATTLECILLLPCSIEKDLDTHHSESTHQSSGYPLIVMVHGGPHGNYTARFFREAAYLCSTQRMAILMVNYRLGI